MGIAERPPITDETEIHGGETGSVLDISINETTCNGDCDADDENSVCGVCSDPLYLAGCASIHHGLPASSTLR